MDCDEISTVFLSETDPSFFQNSCTENSNILDREITHEGAEKKEKKSGEAVNQIRPDDPMLEFSIKCRDTNSGKKAMFAKFELKLM